MTTTKLKPPKEVERPPVESGGMVEVATPVLGGVAPKGTPGPRGFRPEDYPPFWICAHPDRWAVNCGRVVPVTRRFKATHGANGVDRDGNGRPVVGPALAELADKGWIAVPWDVDGAGTSYLRRIPSTGGWIDRWTTVYANSASQTFDEVASTAWLESLVERGVIQPCPLYVLERLKMEIERAVQKLAEHGDKFSKRLKAKERDLEVIEAAIGKAQAGGPVPSVTTEARPDIA